MHIAVDIDQTICGSNAYEVYAPFHNSDLGLGIDDAILHDLTSYRDFLLLPQVVSFRQTNEMEWNRSRHRAIATSHVLQAFTPIKDAVASIKFLSRYGSVRYYTARTFETKEVTQSWLEQYGFLNSQEVVCCTSIDQKMRELAHHDPFDEPILLIDDRGHTHVLTALECMKEQTIIQGLLKRLKIVAFGAAPSALPETALCPLVALPDWSQLSSEGFYL